MALSNAFQCLLQAENSMTGRTYMGEVLTQEMSELFDKEVNAQKEFEKNFWGSRKLRQAHEKVHDENERNKQRRKNDGHLKYF